jgi:hypothetical protein
MNIPNENNHHCIFMTYDGTASLPKLYIDEKRSVMSCGMTMDLLLARAIRKKA